MIKRKAILLAGVDLRKLAFQDPYGKKWSKSTNEIMFNDITRFENYLKTQLGGGWKSDEIFSFQYGFSSVDECYQHISDILNKSCDYLLFYCIGHGCSEDDGHEGIELYVGEDQESHVFWIEWLNILATEHSVNSHLFIINSCRTQSYIDEINIDHHIVSFDSLNCYEDNDEAYMKALNRSNNEMVTVYSTKKGRAAIFSNKGAYFSESLFTAIEAWSSDNHGDNVLTISTAIARTNQFMRKYKQEAEILISHGDFCSIPIAAKS